MVIAIGFTSCVMDSQDNNDNIDKSTEQAKQIIDRFSEKAKDVLKDENMDQLKDLVDNIAEKTKGLDKDKNFWKQKLEDLGNNQQLKEALKDYGKNTEELINDPKLKDKLEKLKGNKTVDKFINDLLDLKDNQPHKKLLQEQLNNLENDPELKELLEHFKGDAEDLINNPAWKQEVQKLKNDEDVKRLLKRYKGDAEDIFKQLDEIFKSFSSKKSKVL